MKKLTFFLILFASVSFAQMGITAIFDGPLPGGLPKGVELYVYENIADLSIYQLGNANNGGSPTNSPFTFPAVSASAGDYIYITYSAPEFFSFFSIAANYESGVTSINGDDVMLLYKNGEIIDAFGELGVDGTGTVWEYLDGWAKSKNGRQISATFNPDDWIYSGINMLEGGLTNDECTVPLPIGGSGVLPVEISTFSASVSANAVELSWNTATETNNYGFDVERSYDNSKWTKVDFVKGAGNSNSAKSYSYSDKGFEKSSSLFYRLKQVDLNGTFKYSAVIEVSVAAPASFELTQNYPNPFNPSTVINFTMPKDEFVNLSIYNVLGEKVEELLNGVVKAGTQQVKFNAQRLNSGIYFASFKSNSFAKTIKMMLVK